MLINNKESERVKFVSYTGKYPNLCSGILTLEIDGMEWTFGSRWKKPKPDFNSFWSPGGYVRADEKWNFDVHEEEWKINVEDLPEQFREYAAEIDKVFNKNVEYGCCGGCI